VSETASAITLGQASGLRLRPARIVDVEALELFISEYTHDGTLLPRTRANLAHHVRDFRVAMAGGRLVGCGALQVGETTLAEVRTVAVDPAWRGRGVGRRIVESLLRDARRLGLARVFCLTRRPDFFASHGFVEVPKAYFPHKVWNDCRLCPRRHACDEIAMERVLGFRGSDQCFGGTNSNP
jgi:argininosuccinate lyase/amino-acid N-acetyltransferase